MSDFSLNHDLYAEAVDRRHREAEALVRSRSNQREARIARALRLRASSRRARLVAVVAPTVGILAYALATGALG